MRLLMNWWQGWRLRQLGVGLPADTARYGRHSHVLAEPGCVLPQTDIAARGLRIGAFTYVHQGSSLNMAGSIGRYCSISSSVTIGADSRTHPLDWLSSHPFQYNGDTGVARTYQSDWKEANIGHDVWIGRDAVIMKGVQVGTGAVIGVRSIVTRDVPPYAIVAGSPARVLRYRFDEDVRARLLQSEWWRASPRQLSDIPFDDIKRALDCLEQPGRQATTVWQPPAVSVMRKGRSLRIARADALSW